MKTVTEKATALRRSCISRLCRPFTEIAHARHFSTAACDSLISAIDWPYAWAASYGRQHLTRFAVTMDWLHDLPRETRVLELGATPFIMTTLLRHFLFDRVEINVLPPRLSEQPGSEVCQRLTRRQGKDVDILELAGRSFNVETELWPFSDESFDLVIACEIMEHLTKDPMNVLAEANRILRPGGTLLLTTPNVVRFGNAVALHLKQPPNRDPFYRPNPYDRHNREFSPDELRALLFAGGFEINRFETLNFSSSECTCPSLLFAVAHRLLWRDATERRDYMFARARKSVPVRERFPTAQRLYKNTEQFEKEDRARSMSRARNHA